MSERLTIEPESASAWPPAPELIEAYLGGTRQGICVVEPVGRMHANRQARGLAGCLAMPMATTVGALTRAAIGPAHGEQAGVVVALLVYILGCVFLDRCFRQQGGEYDLQVRADGDGVSFAGPRRQTYVRWLDIVGINTTEDRTIWQCADGSEVPVPAMANLHTIRQVAECVVALRIAHTRAQGEAEEQQLRCMDRGLSPAEDSADADRGLSVSP